MCKQTLECSSRRSAELSGRDTFRDQKSTSAGTDPLMIVSQPLLYDYHLPVTQIGLSGSDRAVLHGCRLHAKAGADVAQWSPSPWKSQMTTFELRTERRKVERSRWCSSQGQE